MRGRVPGFSLLELLVVMAVISLVLSLAVPRLSASLEGMALKHTSRELALALKHLHRQAIRRGQVAELLLYLDRHEYALGQQGKRHALPRDIHITLTTGASEQVDAATGAVRFYADGSASGGEIRLAQGGRDTAIQINWLTGRVVVHD